MSTSNDLIRTWFKFICYMGHRFLSLNEWDHRAQMGGQTIDIPSRIPLHHHYIHYIHYVILYIYIFMNYGWFCAQTHVWGFDFDFLASEITICRLQGSPNRWKKHIFQDVIDDVDSINSRFPTSWGLRKKKNRIPWRVSSWNTSPLGLWCRPCGPWSSDRCAVCWPPCYPTMWPGAHHGHPGCVEGDFCHFPKRTSIIYPLVI